MRKTALNSIMLIALVISFISPLANAASLTVTATVPAKADDFSSTLSNDDAGITHGKDEEITYVITYGSSISYSSSVVIEASWSRGTLEGDQYPSLDVASYVAGSASDAEGGYSPIIDTINRKITWNIGTLAGNSSDKTVTFKLKTTSSVSSARKVTFTASTALTGPGITTPNSSIDSFYMINDQQGTTSPTNVPTPTSPPSPTSGKAPVGVTPAIPSPTISEALKIKTVEIFTKTSDAAQVRIVTSRPTITKILYGTSPTNLSSSVMSIQATSDTILDLTSLESSNKYYFQIAIPSTSVTSDIYTFITASEENKISPVISTLVVSSGNTILTSPLQTSLKSPGASPKILLPQGSKFDFRITIPNSKNIALAQAIIRKDNVLGLFSYKAYAETESIDLVEVSPDIFAGQLSAKADPGLYNVTLRISDIHGNITEKEVSKLQIFAKLKVVSANDKRPIEATRVLLSLWNSRKNRFEQIRAENTSIHNPSFTNENGEVDIVLPRGKYLAAVSNINFVSEKIEFTIGDGDKDGYPYIELEGQRLNLVNIYLYHLNNFTELLFPATRDYFGNLAKTSRLYDVQVLVVSLSFIILLLTSLFAKLQLPLIFLPKYFHYLLKKSLSQNPGVSSISGRVIEGRNETPIQGAIIYLIDLTSQDVIAHSLSSQKGDFSFKNLPDAIYSLHVAKRGFHQFNYNSLMPTIESKTLLFALTHSNHRNNFFSKLTHLFNAILSASFELILLFSFFFAAASALSGDFIKIAPILAICAFNIIVWTNHRNHGQK